MGARSNSLTGALWMITSGLMFVSVAITVRYLGSDLPASQSAFIRYVFGLALLIPVMMRMQWQQTLIPHFKLHILRGIAHGTAVTLWFYAMARIPLAEVTAISYITPFYTAIGAVLIFHEKIYARRIGAIIFGFIGTLIILRPGFREIELGHVAQLMAVPCFAISFLVAKRLTQSISSSEITVMLSICCTLVLMPGALMDWHSPTTIELLGLFLIAIFATFGHYALTRAFAAAPLTVTQPVSFLQLVWAILFGYLLFGEQPDVGVLIGSGVIITSVSYLTHREVLAAKRSAPPS